MQTGEEGTHAQRSLRERLYTLAVLGVPDVHPLGPDDASPPACRVEVDPADSGF